MNDEYLTHRSPGCKPPWIAVHRASAIAYLQKQGFKLTHDQQNDIGYLMASFCRVLDEAGLIGYGTTCAKAIADAKKYE